VRARRFAILLAIFVGNVACTQAPTVGPAPTFTASVVAIKRPYVPQGPGRPAAKTGNEWVSVQLQLVNTGSAVRQFSYDDFKLVTADHSRWESSNLGYGNDPARLGFGQLDPKDTVLGWIMYEVPIGSPAVSVIWSPSPGNQSVTLNLP